MDTENVIHKNRGEDMKVLVALGEQYAAGVPFRIEFYSGKYGLKRYVCEYDGEEYKNCQMAEGGRVLCLLDGHGLTCGILRAKVTARVPDGGMPDGDYRVVSDDFVYVEGKMVELCDGKSDTQHLLDAATMTLLAPIVKGEDADIAGCDAAIAAAEATNDKVQRAEVSRMSAEEARVSAEAGRVSAEEARVSAELARESAEGKRAQEFTRTQDGRADAFATEQQGRADDYAGEKRSRGTAFASEQQQRASAYADAEAARDTLAEGVRNGVTQRAAEAESARSTAANAQRAAEQSAYEEAESKRDTLAANVRNSLQEQYAKAETRRDTAYSEAEGVRNANETGRQDAFTVAEEGRVSAFNQSQQQRARTFEQSQQVRADAFGDLVDDMNAAIRQAESVDAVLTGTEITVTDHLGNAVTRDLKGEKGDTGEKGDKGDKGERGEKGDKGEAADIEAAVEATNAANAAAARAGRVNATVSGSVLTLTDTEGVSHSIDLLEAESERVIVTVRSGVAGVSCAGLTLLVYDDGDTQDPEMLATDASGVCAFTRRRGVEYRIVFPQVDGCKDIRDVVNIASASSRTVAVEYVAQTTIAEETVAVYLRLGSDGSAGGGTVTQTTGAVNVTVGGATRRVESDATGLVTFTVPIGETYIVDVPHGADVWITAAEKHRVLTADRGRRALSVLFHPVVADVMIVDEQGVQWGFDDFKAAVEGGTRSLSDGVLIAPVTSTLIDHNALFAVSVDELATRHYRRGAGVPFKTMQWGPSNSVFTTIPSNEYQYDGLTNTDLIAEEGVRIMAETAAAFCKGETFTRGDGTVMQGFLGSRGQWDALWNNRGLVDEMLAYLRPNAQYNLSGYTAGKWSSDQSGDRAYYLGSGWGSNFKNSGYAVVPFFAL